MLRVADTSQQESEKDYKKSHEKVFGGTLSCGMARGRNKSQQNEIHKKKLMIINSVALVRERTIPSERPPPVSEVSANFCR